MFNHFDKYVLFAIALHLVIPLFALEIPENFKKFENGDNEYAQFFTKLIQCQDEFPYLPIPKLDPYVFPNAITLETIRLTSILSTQICWENITFYGAKNAVVEEVSGFQPCQSSSEVRIRVTVPKATICLNTNSKIQLLAMHVQTKGKSTTNIDNIELEALFTTNMKHRNGKDYLTISSFSTECNVSHVDIDIKYEKTAPLVNNMISRIANTNWKLFQRILYRSVEKHLTNLFTEMILMPILDQIACQDVIKMNCTSSVDPN